MHKWLIRMLRYIDTRVLYTFVAVFVIPVCLLLNPSRSIAYRYFRRRIGYGRLKSAWNREITRMPSFSTTRRSERANSSRPAIAEKA